MEVVSSNVETKQAQIDAVHGACSQYSLEFRRQSSYEKVSIMALTASIERPGDDWFTREIIWFHPSPECKARVEFYDPAKRRKAYFHSFTLSAPPYSGF